MDRHVSASPALEKYTTTLKAYTSQFGVPLPTIWPAFNSDTAFATGYNGFVNLPVSAFMDFHNYFSNKYKEYEEHEA